jgi:hypothetical protein
VGTLFLGLIVVIVGGGFLGFSKSSGVRTASRVVSFALFAAFGAVAAFSFYEAVATRAKGGMVLLIVAVPSAFIAWLAFSSFWASLSNEGYFDLDVSGKIAHNEALIDRQIREHTETIAEKSKKLESFWISPAKRRRLRDDVRHARAMVHGLSAMRPKVADPSIYQGDEA